MKNMPYQITVAWSDDDEGYVARVPALRYCVAFGETPEKAVKEVRTAAAEIIRVMKEDGKALPSVDATLHWVMYLQPVINLSAVATAAGMKVQTLASKIARGTAFTPDESSRIGKVFMSHGITPSAVALPGETVMSFSDKVVGKGKARIASAAAHVLKKASSTRTKRVAGIVSSPRSKVSVTTKED